MTKKIKFYLPAITAMSLVCFNGYAQDFGDDFSILEPAEEAGVIYFSEIELGIGWNSKDSFKFGEFSGLTDRGPFVIGNFTIRYQDAWDDENAKFFRATGTDLGLSSRNLNVEFGNQGSFEIRLNYDQIPKNLHDDARTPYILNNGGTELVLPANWVASNRSVSNLTLLNSSLQDIKITHERTRFGGGFTVNLSKEWTVSTDVRHETKQGNRTIAAIFGSNGGNPAGAVIPEPVDYRTVDYALFIGYVGKRSQFNLSYTLSDFNNNKQTLRFQNPFDSTRWSTPYTSFPTGFGQMQLPPNNQAHRFSFAGRYELNEKTRITANLEYNKYTQNDPFAAFTIDPNIVINTPLPRASLEGEVVNTVARLGMTSRISNKANFNLSYRYNNRDNNTEQDVFIRVPNESSTQGDLTSSNARINLPYGRKQHLVDATFNYRLASGLKLDFGYAYEQLERDFQEVAKTKEHKLKAKLRSNSSGSFSGWIGLDYTARTGSEYIDNAPFQASHFAAEEGDLENNPLVRKFFMANRDRLKISASGSYEVSDKLMLFLSGRYAKDDYDESTVGLIESSNASVTLDSSYQASEEFSAHAFFTYENYSNDQAGISTRRGDPFEIADRKGWTVSSDDRVTTVGLGLEWDGKDSPYSFDLDYTFSRAITDYDLTAGPELNFLPLPDLRTRIHSANISSDYQYADNIAFRLRYLLEDYSSSDFSLDNIDPDSTNLIILLGNQSPNYTAHVIGFSTVFGF